ncbi:uncharacterized protein TNCV_2669181 [Trichonephila clavipes]|nr:uncharacterized protein TNCV_2669181 [Trichonephila clavipes]
MHEQDIKEIESLKPISSEDRVKVPEPNEIGNVIEEVVRLVGQINLKVDSDDVQELLDFHKQELTVNEIVEMHEQDIKEIESLKPISFRRSKVACLLRKPKFAGSTLAGVDRFAVCENRRHACRMIMRHAKDPLSINLAQKLCDGSLRNLLTNSLGFQECDEEDVETWMACDAEDCGFQILNDNEIVASYKKNPTLSMMKRMKTSTTTGNFLTRRLQGLGVKDLVLILWDGDQGDTPEIMDEILTTARDLELEVNEDDIEELIMGHEDELTIEELQQILNEEHQKHSEMYLLLNKRKTKADIYH